MIKQAIKTTAAAGLIAFTSSAFADNDANGFFVWADVTDVVPLISTRYEEVPVESCRIVRTKHTETKHTKKHKQKNNRRYHDDAYRQVRVDDYPRQQNALPALFGGLIGGAIGNQFGSGNGKKAMTLIGAIAGASIAANNQRDVEHRADAAWDNYRPAMNHAPRSRRVCETRYERREYQEIEGYEVTYAYLGREFEQMTEDHPGDRLKLYVTVGPYHEDLI